MYRKIAVISKKYNRKISRTVWLSLTHITPDFALLTSDAPVNLIEHDGIKILPWAAKVYIYFKEWFNIFVFFDKQHIHAYCNIATPAVFENDEISFIDLDLDLIINQNREIELKDENEFLEHKEKFSYPKDVEIKAREAVTKICNMVLLKQFPFDSNNWENFSQNRINFSEE